MVPKVQRYVVPVGVFAFFTCLFILGYKQALGTLTLDSFLESTLHLDVKRYISVAEFGYRLPDAGHDGGDNVFFPLFPFLIWIGQQITGWSYIVAANVLQKFIMLVALCVAWKWVQLQFGAMSMAAKLSLLALVIHPAAVFLFVPYTEALALIFLFIFLWAWDGRRLSWLFLSALLMSLTRPSGMFVAPVVVLVWLIQLYCNRNSGSCRWPALRLSLPPVIIVGVAVTLAFVSLMFWQHWVMGDAIAFLRYRVLWNESSSWSHFLRLFQIDLGGKINSIIFVWIMVAGCVVLVRQNRLLEAVLCIFSIFMFIYQGKLGDFVRYSYAAIPAWMCLFKSSYRRPLLFIALVVFAAFLGAINYNNWLLKQWVG